jgi:hypothetical protein
VVAEDGASKISAPDQASLSVLRDRLYTAGELLRTNQLTPGSVPDPDSQLLLFDDTLPP